LAWSLAVLGREVLEAVGEAQEAIVLLQPYVRRSEPLDELSVSLLALAALVGGEVPRSDHLAKGVTILASEALTA
jgi:hypothetical protein